jgi:LAO/AO transport system kinase
VKTVATQGEGIDELLDTVDRSYLFFQNSPARAQRKQETERQRIITLLEERLVKTAVEQLFPDGEFNKVIAEIAARRTDPYSVVEQIVRNSRFQRLNIS